MMVEVLDGDLAVYSASGEYLDEQESLGLAAQLHKHFSLDTALAKRVELNSAGLQLENANLDLKAAKDSRLPQLDMVLELSTDGLGGDGPRDWPTDVAQIQANAPSLTPIQPELFWRGGLSSLPRLQLADQLVR